jgi:outer membrane autotransporter protein
MEVGELREAIRRMEDGCAWGSTALRGLGDVFAGRNGALRRRLFATTSLVALIVGGSATAHAACVNVTNGAGFTNPTGSTIPCVTVTSPTTNGNVVNAGTITPGSPTGIAINSTVFNGSVINSGAITATGAGIVVAGVSVFTGGITNSGTISAAGAGIVVSGVSSFSGGITNAGTINAGPGAGIVVAGTGCGCGGGQTFTGGITNTGTINASVGIAGVLVENMASFAGGISNSATITGGGAGILVDGVSIFSGGITNNGKISASSSGVIVALVSSFAGGISNAGAIIVGPARGPGILVTEVATFSGGITNAGTITASRGVGILVGSIRACCSVVQTFSGGVINSGTITARTGIVVGDVSTFSGGITNTGTINAARGPGIGVVGTGTCGCGGGQTFAGGITNTGTITSAATAGIIVTNMVSFAGGIANSGTITGSRGGIVVAGVSTFSDGISNTGSVIVNGARGTGIVVTGVSTFAGGISSSGTIAAPGPGILVGSTCGCGPVQTFQGGIVNSGTIVGHTGVVVAGGAHFSGAIVNSGNIIGTGGVAIDVSNAPNAMTIDHQAGTIAGAVKLSAFADTFTMTGGTMVGVVTAGGTIGGIIGQGNGTANFVLGSGTQVFGVGSAITGIGALNISSGKVVLNDGGNLVVGTTSVGGLLQIGDAAHPGASLNSPLVTVGAGGTLAGHGTVVGAITVGPGGTLSPGGSIGTLTVTGNASFAAGSTYRVEVNPAGQSDSLAVSGATSLSGGTLQVLAPVGHYAPVTQYVILTSQGGVTGTFADVTSNSIFLVPTLSYTPTAIDLTLTGLSFTTAAATPNQGSVAGALDRLPSASPIFAAIFNLGSFAQARQAFDALSGEIHASLQTTLIDDSRYPRQAMLGRMRQAAYADQAGDLAALAFGGPEPAGAGFAYQDPHPWPIKAPAPPSPGPDVAYWAQAFGAWGHIDGDGNAAREQRNLAGFMTGVDARIGPLTRVGLAAGYTHSSVNVDARASSAGIDTAQLGAYALTSLGGFNLRTGAAYGFHTIDTNRTIAFPGFLDAAAARYDGGTAQLFGEVGYGLMMGPVALEPVAGLGLVHLHADGFSETGGPAALSGTGNNETVGYSTLGLRMATAYQLAGGMVLMPRATLAWQHAIGEVTPSAALAFRDTGVAFAVAGVPLARDSALVEAGLDLRVTPSARLGLSYAGELAGHAQDHAVKGSFTWNF